MEADPGLAATRAIREKISREHGNDPRRLVEHYMEHQRRFANRLRWSPGADPLPKQEKEAAPAPDAGAKTG